MQGNEHLPGHVGATHGRHITAEHRREKLTRHRSQPITAEYGIATFAARHEARRLNVTRADGPKPPDAAKTRGVKEAISTSQTRWSYCHRLCCSWRRKTEAVERRASFERARGLKTRTSKNAHSHTQFHFPSSSSFLLSVLALGPTVIPRVYFCLDLGPETGRLQHV